MLSFKEALSDEPLKITTKKINFSLKKFTKSRRRGQGKTGEQCRDVACYVWEMRKMGEIIKNKGRMTVILHLLGNSQSYQLFDIIEKEPLLGSVVKALWW
jgi:hypothetical protein